MLSERITSVAQLRVLVLRLGIPHHRLEASLCNNRSSIEMAAYDTLMEWFHSVPDKEQAYNYLCSALEEANMVFLIKELTK